MYLIYQLMFNLTFNPLLLQPSSANIEDIDLTRIATNTSYTATEAGILSCL